MANFNSKCPHCATKLSAEEEYIGMNVQCPECSKDFILEKSTTKNVSPPPSPKDSLASFEFICIGCGDRQKLSGDLKDKPYACPKCNYISIANGARRRKCYNCGKFISGKASRCMYCDETMGVGRGADLYRIAGFLEDGKNVEQDLDLAIKYYHKSLEAGYCYASLNLGTLYVEQGDAAKAIKIMLPFAEKGDVLIQCGIAMFYEVQRNYPKAIEYYTLATANGNPDAAYNLGVLYLEGIHIEQNINKAISCFLVGAESENSDCLFKLASIEDHFSYAEKIDFLARAASHGHLLSIECLKLLILES